MNNKDMQTKDPALTKTLIDEHNVHDEHGIYDGDRVRNDSTHDGIVDIILADNNTRIDNDGLGHDNLAHNNLIHTDEPKGTKTFQETVIGTRYVSDDAEHGDHMHADIHHNNYNVMSTGESIEDNTTVNKGTDTFKEGIVNTEHVKDNDNPARQPDRRDQEGNAFDEGVNEHTTVDDGPKSTEINDLNRYANLDNAQARVLNPDEKDL